ncbi:pilin [Pseudomonas nitroreducens]|uniref:Pilin n=1 Tax=Pseudomonas nitroreducens TaxID=46680 RepID=A0A246F7B8_PSENT|nr:prepilin-type N-terminal cleavage/methylation domain-containing protein [Pseudomonas nitroreducens]OWP49107.1 pilus assembly protein TapA [Pseudomonas nitroreducens]
MVKQQGFTLIELMIVVAIIGILASVSIPIYSDYSSRSKATAAIAEMSGIKTAVGMCMAEAAALSDCKGGAYGIPESFETSNVPSGYSVTAGKIVAITSATSATGDPLELALEPVKDSKSSMIIWKLSGTICNDDRGIKFGTGGCAKTAKEG